MVQICLAVVIAFLALLRPIDRIIVIQKEIATIVTRNQMKYAKENQIPPDEKYEDFESEIYKEKPVLSVTHGYENSSETEDVYKLAEMLPTVHVLPENSLSYFIMPNA